MARAAAREAKLVAYHLQQDSRASKKAQKGPAKELDKSQEPEIESDCIVVRARAVVQKPATSSSGRVIRPTKRVQD